ncbi:MAG: OmpH family outer membrane protein [Bacteroidales bacterium]|nr:OmpH family outer membrane protein [Bacteroidales bacterium]
MKKIMMIAAMALVSIAAMAQAPKFAHVNFNELIQLMPEMDSARDQIDAASREAQETYQAMMEEFQSKYQQYEQKQATWTPAVKQSKEKELGEIQNRIGEFQENIQAELQQQQQVLMAPIYQKAQETVTNLAKAGGYIYVFDASQVLYLDASQSTDLTPAARTALNIPEDRTMESLQAELQAKAAAAQQ